MQKKHFKCVYRFDPKYWVAYDGMDTKREKLLSIPILNLKDIRFLLFGRCDILKSNEAFVDEVITNNIEDPVNNIDKMDSSSRNNRIKVTKTKKKSGTECF